jgi:hypothetical protein
MGFGIALSLVLMAIVAGVGAGLSVLIEWSRLASLPAATSPARWAARSYLAHFDLWAAATFLPSCVLCRWLRLRAGRGQRPLSDAGISPAAKATPIP